MTWITTHSGRHVDLIDPQPDQIAIEDIAYSLSLLCRFTGHVSTFYSVAQHSVLVSRALPRELQLKGLLHDCHEAYIGDLSSPLKAALLPTARAEFRQLELDLLAVIGEAFGVDLSCDPQVKHVDRMLLRAEAELLLPAPIAGASDLPESTLRKIIPWRPQDAAEVFLQTFHRLMEPAVVERGVLCNC